jgi:predicted nucleic acid-binding protein
VITAIDSNVIFDLLTNNAVFGLQSQAALRSCVAEGKLVVCDVVCAEIAGWFPSVAMTRQALAEMGIDFSPLTMDCAFAAGIAWKSYRARGGARRRVAADFLIGAHALRQADRLLTRDRGFYRTYFKHLSILDPSKDR